MGTYNDAVLGRQWQLTRVQEAFRDHPAHRQLGGKRQLGLAYRVYPGARHTREEHSFGVSGIASLLADDLALSERESTILQIAGLGHDWGHLPGSHASEEPCNYDHESAPQRVLRGEDWGAIDADKLCSTIHSLGVEPEDVRRVLSGEMPLLSQMISNKIIDIDRLDYLTRDLLACGVEYAMNTRRLHRKLRLIDGVLGVADDGVDDLVMFYASRSAAFGAIYHHPVKQAAEAMLKESIRSDRDALADTYSDDLYAQRLHRMTDSDLSAALRASPSPRARSLIELVEGPRDHWYDVRFDLGGEQNLALAQGLLAKKEVIRAALAPYGCLVEFSDAIGKVGVGKTPPAFPIEGGASLWNNAIARGVWDYVPKHLMTIYTPKDAPQVPLERIIADVV